MAQDSNLRNIIVEMDLFVGIDLAFAKRKRLPICICRWDELSLVPIELGKDLSSRVPRGHGNKSCIDNECLASFATQVEDYLHLILATIKPDELGQCVIRRIAIDAPMGPSVDAKPRNCEVALGRRGISYFKTPSAVEFNLIRKKAQQHIEEGGAASQIPYANKLWMLAGFELFQQLKREWDCIEVYPQATMRVIGAASIHKAQKDGPITQLQALARFTGWRERVGEDTLKALCRIVRAPSHDAVDAYSSAWVAALEEPERIPLGCPPDDAIWIPNRDLLKWRGVNPMH